MAGNIYHEWNGTTLIITSDSGTSSCNLVGQKGDIGVRGPQGSPGVVFIDDTLDNHGYAADAKTVGDTFAAQQEEINAQQEAMATGLAEQQKYAEELFNGANKALSYENYEAFIGDFNSVSSNGYSVGQNVMIITLNVPDLWISAISETYSEFTFESDEALVNTLKANGSIQVGYFVFSALETQKVDLTNYVEKEEGKQLSTEDYTTEEKAKVANIETTINTKIPKIVRFI